MSNHGSVSPWLLLFVSVFFVHSVSSASDPRVDRVETWLNAVDHHEPGLDDDAVRRVGAWTNADVRTLWVDVNVLVQMMRNPRGVQFALTQPGQKRPTPVRYSTDQFRRLKALAESARLKGDDYVIRRGALLHTDIAILGLESPEAISTAPNAGSQRIRLDTADGQAVGLVRGADHWEIARTLLDFVKPADAEKADPGHDGMVRLWYRATAAWMQNTEHHDRQHLDRGRVLFPNDPDILFLSACQHEVYAGPQIQDAARAVSLPAGFSLDVLSERAELREAETLFRRALAARPEFADARLRYGRVLGRLGKHADAAVELRQVVTTVDDLQLEYYGQLFLGAEEEALARFDAARAAYERAAELGPLAQSPRIALSQLARRRGDRASALKFLQDVFALPVDSVQSDWWWSYDVAQARDAKDLLAELRQPFLKKNAE